MQDFGPISLFVEFTKKIKKADACSLSPFLYTNLRVMRLWNEAGFRLKFICVTIFFGTAALGTLQDVKRERPTSRFAAV